MRTCVPHWRHACNIGYMVLKSKHSRTTYLGGVVRRIPLALLCAAALSFTLFLFTPMDIYAGNRTEFLFSFRDMGAWLLALALAGTLILGALISLTPGRVSAVIGAVVFWLGVMGYIQGMFLNIGLKSLLGDGGAGDTPLWLYILDTFLWIASGAAAVIGAMHIDRNDLIRTAAGIALVVVLGMQVVGSISILGKVFDLDSSRAAAEASDGSGAEDASAAASDTLTADGTQVCNLSSDKNREYGDGGSKNANRGDGGSSDSQKIGNQKVYLSDAGLCNVARGKNTIVFVLDRFDYTYYKSIAENDPDFFAPLTGFTLFDDNLSLYSRTYPAVASMITGVKQEDEDGNPFGQDADTYFASAYADSPFLRELKANGYAIRLYTGYYYGYRSAEPLAGIADNVEVSDGYRISNRGELAEYMIGLAGYRLLPQLLKNRIHITTAMFNSLVQYIGDNPAYVLNDWETFAKLSKEGLTVDTEGAENAFLFIHLNGSHTPCHMDADGNYKRNATIEESTKGCFNLIYRYIAELKRLGLYENATILITGDHPWGRDNEKDPAEPRLTPVFVKPSGTCEEALKTSSAQVCQELNMQAFLVTSSGLTTDRDWGVSYMEVPEGVNIARRHLFVVSRKGKDYVSEFTVNGNGHDFSNWKKTGSTEIGSLYR